ncbi:N-6 DNA methylase [Reichenbachiella carrageenanivorans]|uniref:N-6 DNA methylase n=1 Tax=Reichenbachiella carrageenanivorans TaxID=2979869 RepID=A0ABY6CZX3_9BACT|nr:N-6 DNA methylase [Reichenbachiella carrageenanivorans]UXX79469.1 N-6 DNA methylase [Reichenbachiella carrageenanivorans]
MQSLQKDLIFPLNDRDDYLKVFKEIYYHLYSNSNVSRAEVLIKDISKVLLYCLSNTDQKKSDSDTIFKVLKKQYPDIEMFITPFELEKEHIEFVFDKLIDIDIQNAPAHIIGDAFQSLVGPNLRGDKGQFFTPKSVVSSMVQILSPKESDVICDPACGTGGFLVEAFTSFANNKKHFCGQLIGIEKDEFLSNTATSILEIYSKSNFNIINRNSLDLRDKDLARNLGEVDVILTNPPFGAKIGIKDKEILGQYEFGHSWSYVKSEDKWFKSNQLLNEQSPQLLFLELCFKLLKKGGKAGIVLPEGIFGNKSLGYVWDYIRSQGQIIGMIDCPRTLFQPSTDVKTNILFFEKGTESKNEFLVAVAENCGHDKRGRSLSSKGEKVKDDFDLLGKSFNNGLQNWSSACVKDKYYVVPRYCVKENNWKNKQIFEFDVKSFISINELVDSNQLAIRKGNEVGSEAYGTGDIPFIRTSDLINLEINYDPTKSVSEEVYSNFKSLQSIEENDILMVADGRYRIGKTSMILNGMTKCVVQSHVKIIRVLKSSIYSPFELLYIFNQKPVIQQIRSLIFIQSTLGSIGNRLNELILPIPEKNDSWNLMIQDFTETLVERNRLLHKLNDNIIDDVF